MDNSVLSDYLRSDAAHHDEAATVIEGYEGTWYAPTPVLWEALRYGAQSQRQDGVRKTAAALDWLEPMPLTPDTAREAALIEAELLDKGTLINALDMLIAGIVREAGATLVTREEDFKRVEGIEVASTST